MKAIHLFALTASALLASAGAQAADLLNSPHDLSTASTNGGIHTDSADGTGQICVFCHTPHNANAATFGPLWNRNYAATTANFTVYSSPTFQGGTITLGARSLACLSCHDGTLALDNLANTPGSGTETWSAPGIYTFVDPGSHLNTNHMISSGMAYLSQDLSNDHPVGFTYATSAAADAEAQGGIRAAPRTTGTAGPVLFAGQVECATCHNPHDHDGGGPALVQSGAIPFLRDTTDGSYICFDCHNK